MKRKWSSTLALSATLGLGLASHLSYAETTQPKDYQGFFGGVNVGVLNSFGKIEAQSATRYPIIFADAENTLTLDSKSKVSRNRLEFGLLLGYSWLFSDSFY